MESNRFDEVTRRFGAARSRRGVIGAAIAALGSGVVTVEAAPIRRSICRPVGTGCSRGSQCCSGLCPTDRALPRAVRNRCACPEGEAWCNGACVDVNTDALNCGACRRACDSSETDCCDGTCVDPDYNNDHCGACDQSCDVVNGESCCRGDCVTTQSDAGHCGYCNQACDTVNGETCISGVCTCGGPQLGDACTVDSDCCDYPNMVCSNAFQFPNTCRKAEGVACSEGSECFHNYCISGVCRPD
jgi:hypothetical protein